MLEDYDTWLNKKLLNKTLEVGDRVLYSYYDYSPKRWVGEMEVNGEWKKVFGHIIYIGPCQCQFCVGTQPRYTGMQAWKIQLDDGSIINLDSCNGIKYISKEEENDMAQPWEHL